VEALQYYLSWRCSKVVLYYQTIDGEQCEEVVCNTGNISSQDTRHCLYMYAKDVIYYMHEKEQSMLRIYIGMENVIAVDFSTQRDEDGEYVYDVMYLTSPTLSAMVPGLLGSSSFKSSQTLPTKSEPTSAALV
jgi:hypothetical protein